MLIISRIAFIWLLFVGLAHADGTVGVGADGLTFGIGNGIGNKGSKISATGYTWSGPSTGTAGSPSTNFTVTAVVGSAFNGAQTITISDGSTGGTITPSVGSPGTSSVTVTPTAGSTSFKFTYTAARGDAITLTGTNGQSWSNPSPLTYTGAVTYTMTGPSTGTAGSPSSNFTVSMPAGTKFSGTDTITIADGSKGGTITPSVGSPGTSTVTVTPTAATSSFTFTYTAVLGDAITLTGTNGQSWTNPSPLTYTGGVTYTMSGPSTGAVNVASTNFTVAMPAGVKFSGSDTVTLGDGTQGGTFTPSVGSTGVSTVTVTPAANATSFTFTYTPVVIASLTLAATNAQSWTNPATLNYISTYAGPADVVASPLHCWSLRACSAALATALTNLAIITRASDSTTCTVISNSSGNLDLVGTPCAGSTTITSWCNATTCSVTTLYDQGSGGNNMTSLSLAKSPTLTLGCASHPCMTTALASLQCLTDGESGTLAQPATTLVVASRTASFSTVQDILTAFTSSGVLAPSFNSTTGQADIYAGTSVALSVSNTTLHTLISVISGSSSVFNIDGTDNTSLNPGAATFHLPWNIAGRNTCTNFPMSGLSGDFVVWGSGTSTTPTQRTSLCHNARTYWGSTGSC